MDDQVYHLEQWLTRKLRRLMRRFERARAEIIAVGTIVNGKPENWTFDCDGHIPAIEVSEDGEIFYGGYSVAELAEISAQHEQYR